MCNTLILQRKLKNIKHGVYYVFFIVVFRSVEQPKTIRNIQT